MVQALLSSGLGSVVINVQKYLFITKKLFFRKAITEKLEGLQL